MEVDYTIPAIRALLTKNGVPIAKMKKEGRTVTKKSGASVFEFGKKLFVEYHPWEIDASTPEWQKAYDKGKEQTLKVLTDNGFKIQEKVPNSGVFMIYRDKK